jgi:hypothetical protein
VGTAWPLSQSLFSKASRELTSCHHLRDTFLFSGNDCFYSKVQSSFGGGDGLSFRALLFLKGSLDPCIKMVSISPVLP